MRRNLLICVLLAAMLVEASCFSEECWNSLEIFLNDLKNKLENLSGLIYRPNYSFSIVRGCIVPEPPNGARIAGVYPGQTVPPASRLTYSCTDRYIMRGSEISICSDGVWHDTPTCMRSETEELPRDVDYSLINPRFGIPE